MLQRAASNAYSWWWASHIRTRQSKWLDSNLQDMEDRVKFILFLLGEEADSFAKRAEMYYKRRPEVISSVEDAYRSYRALAERYDHISGELHKANHTIATAFPDQVQYSMLEEDDDNLPKAFVAVDPGKIHKSTVEGLMAKKRGGKPGFRKDGGKISGAEFSKKNVQGEISRLQKEILALQTEKEFIKSSYESGIAKYWDLEKKINGMQEEVCYFQEEFNESAVLEDDEARALMTATALKSCQDTIIKLQEQKLSFSQGMVESERVKVSGDKLKNIMRENGKCLSGSGEFLENTDSGNFANENVTNDDSNKVYDLYSVEHENIELQGTVGKIKEYFQTHSEVSVEETADKIDELVNKVVDLELMISSWSAQFNRLCLENTELEKSLHELEEEKTVLTSCPGKLSTKLKKAEEQLIGVQSLASSFRTEGTIVHSNFSETITMFLDVSGMLWSPLVEYQVGYEAMLTDKKTTSFDTEASSQCDKTNPAKGTQLDESEGEHGIDVLSDHSNKLEPENFCETKEENYYGGGVSEDLLCCALGDKSSSAATTVNKETERIEDSNRGEHAPETTSDNSSSMQQWVVHSIEKPILERPHHICSNRPEDYNVKREENDQDLSTSDHTIFEGNSEQNTNNAGDSFVVEDTTTISRKVDKVEDQEENMLKLQHLLMNGLQDKEKVLLNEYTSILRNYKTAKRRLTELETENQERLNEMATVISELRCANAMKDEEIRLLHELLNSSTDKYVSRDGHQMNPTTSLSFKSKALRGHRRTPGYSPIHQRKQSASSISRIIRESSFLKTSQNQESQKEGDASHDTVTDQESLILEDIKLIDVVKMENTSPLEEKFRRDIDALLGENLEFWMKFSTSFQKIQGFQTRYEQVQPEIKKLINEDMHKTNNGHAYDPSAEFESNAVEKQLRELKIELQVWLEQNTMLKGELQYRFASLCSIQEEIEGAMEMGADPEEGSHFTPYQAAKFQGEVLNMKQENNKVANELQHGLDHIRGLQAEIEKIIEKILRRTSSSETKGSNNWRNAPSRSRVPLRLFLFPAKKKKASLLACVNPALQKQHSDMAFFTKMN